MGNGEWRVQTIHRTFAGYSGFLLDVRAALELVMGGPERDFRLGLLKAEISYRKRVFHEAIGRYEALLTETPRQPPSQVRRPTRGLRPLGPG
jgi:hypothetical protein